MSHPAKLCAVAIVVLTALIAVSPAHARKLFVAQADSTQVSVIETATNQLTGSPATVGLEPVSIAMSPGGTRAYVVSATGANVTTIDTSSQTPTTTPLPLGGSPDTIAITPDGSRGYISNYNDSSVQVYNPSTNALVGLPISVPAGPLGLGLTPDGSRLYVTSSTNGTVSVVDTKTAVVVGAPISVGNNPSRIAVTPDGSKVYVSNFDAPPSVSVISTGSNTVTKTITLPADGRGIATSPSGQSAYVATAGGSVNTIDVASDTLTSPTFAQASGTSRVAVTPAGDRLYVSDSASTGVVGAFDAASGTSLGSVALSNNPEALGIVPDQGPTAKFSKKPGAAGAATTFDGGASSDSDGTIVRYDWDFGDGTTLPNGGRKASHVYAKKGKYTATLTVTDNEGASTQDVYTGRSVLRNGDSKAIDRDSFNVPTFAFTASASGTQHVVRQRGVKLTVGCTNVVCDSITRGSITISKKSSTARTLKLRGVVLTLRAGVKRQVKLKLKRRSRRKLSRALRHGRKATATLKLSLGDRAGDRASKTLRIKAKR